MLNQEEAEAIDREFREMYGLTNESTFAFLLRTARTEDSESFVSNMHRALGWLLPRLTPRTRPIFDQIMQSLDELDESAMHASTDEVTTSMKREEVMRLFGQANSLHELEPLLAAQEAFSQSQSARATKPRARHEVDAQMIAKAYWAGHNGRAERGRVKELAREYGVTEGTVRNYAKKYKPDKIA
jgi:hypothetical protein